MVWTGALLLVTALLPAADPADPAWQWPLRPPPEILRAFGPPAHPWEAGHRGVDLAARPGQTVYAAGPGRVGYARDLAGRGVVTVVHGVLRTTYLPVRPSVHTGQVVAAGARIGVVEDVLGHCGQSACLHWGLRQGVTYLDPLALLGHAPVRLLPWWGENPTDCPGGARIPPDQAEVPSPAIAPARFGDHPRHPPTKLTGSATPSGSAGPTELAGPAASDGVSSRPNGNAPDAPATRPSPPMSLVLAIASAGDEPALPPILLAGFLITLSRLRPPNRSRRTAQSYPQIVIALPQKAIFRHFRGRR